VAALAAAVAVVAIVIATGDASDTPTRTTAELVGPIDGFAFALEASGDLHGSLETCGCPKHPMGGYAWRSGYAAELAKATKGEAPIVHADAGRAFAEPSEPGPMPDDVRIKNEWMLRAFDALGVAAINVAHADLAYLAPVMVKKDFSSRAKRFPALSRLVSANVVAANKTVRPFEPYLVRTVSGGRLGKSAVRVGFLGVTEATEKLATSDYTISDPVEAVQRMLPAVRAKSDVVVVLAYVDRATAQKIGALGVDVVIAAHQYPLFNKTDDAGGATVAYVATETKWLSELRMAREASKVTVAAHRDVPLDAATPSDPDAAALVSAARAEFTAAQQLALAPAASVDERRVALAESSPFAGAESCAKCHQYQYAVWKDSQHSHAFRTLEEKNRHLDPACTACHSVRQGEEGGFLDARLTPRLANVQCESCHGPGKQHVLAPKEPGYGHVDTPSRCVSCHTQENDPDFDFATYWRKVKHNEPE